MIAMIYENNIYEQDKRGKSDYNVAPNLKSDLLVRRHKLLSQIYDDKCSSKDLGHIGEKLAQTELELKGVKLIKANVTISFYGQIDIIMQQSKQLLFIEVKTRRRSGQAVALEAITQAKLIQLRKLANLWMAENDYWGPVRIDAFIITIYPSYKYSWMKNL